MKTAHIEKNLNEIKQAIGLCACDNQHKANDVSLLAVSKKQSVEKIRAAIDAGQREFGENQVQEALAKISQLPSELDIIWHYIGTVQSNKTSAIAENFAWLHSLCSLKHAQRLNKQRTLSTPLNVCLQVNIDHEPSKSGLSEEEVLAFAKQIIPMSRLKLRGLMCIPKKGNSEAAFARMQVLFNHCNQHGLELDTLSMGMSDDYRLAIKYGSTMVRIGSALFGSRDQVE